MAIIDKPSDYFNTVLWTGNGVDDRSITGVGFQPDWVWLKQRNGTNYHTSFDVVRGATKRLFPNVNEAEDTNADSLQTFETDGFQVGTNGGVNGNTNTYVSWNWLAGGTASSNTDGSITSNVSASTTSGFSIVSYTGNSTTGATVGHGLNSVPKFIVTKNRTSSTYGWYCYHASLGATKSLYLHTSDAEVTSSTRWNDTTPTSSVFTLGNNEGVNGSTDMIAYCFAEKKGYSKFGSYVAGSDTTAKPNNDGTFIYTGFKPRFIMTKRTDGTSNWCIFDTVRSTLNPMYNILFPNTSDAENTSEPIDVYSNGWKPRADSGYFNYPAGSSWIYYAIAENPFVTSTGVPTTAR